MQGLGRAQLVDPGGKRPLTLQALPLRDLDRGRRAQESAVRLRSRSELHVSRFLLRLRRRLFKHRMTAQMINLFT